MTTELPESLAGRDLVIEGVISAIPEQRRLGQRFEFEIERWVDMAHTEHLPTKLRLSEYRVMPLLEVGQRWHLVVRLKPPHGFMNPGGFDYEAWLLRKQIRALGYVREDSRNRLLGRGSSPAIWLHSQRKALADRIDQAIGESPYRGMIKALALGMRDEMSDGQWQVLLRTGTNHLMAISGLHVGIVAGLGFIAVGWLWRRWYRLLLWCPATQAGAVAAIIFALVYAALAGFSIPTQRAVVMVTGFMIAILLRRFRRPIDGLLLALILVLMFDPLAVMDAGFWLSFAAVAFILLGMAGRLQLGGWWRRWGHVHLLLAVALLPLTVFLFAKASLISPIANLVAVPFVSLIIVPLVLVAVLVSPVAIGLSSLVLSLVEWLFEISWPGLEWLAQLPLASLNFALVSPWLLLPLVIGAVWLLAPNGWPARSVGGLWMGAAILVPQARPAMGEAWFTLLDVGQGLAAVVQTHDHLLVFDTGPSFGKGFDTGAAVVAPYLLQAGWQRIDTLVVSHGDNDHIGGAESLLQQMPAVMVYSSEPERLRSHSAQSCYAGQHWQWDGVEFEMLNPLLHQEGSENNRSCVLRINTVAGGLLLTGDIEHQTEQRLVENVKEGLDVELMVVPHHGSKTSSSKEFIATVSPRWALFPVGYRNRFGLPRQEVVERYDDAGVACMFSGYSGAIEVRFEQNGISPPHAYRWDHRRYWYHMAEGGWSPQ